MNLVNGGSDTNEEILERRTRDARKRREGSSIRLKELPSPRFLMPSCHEMSVYPTQTIAE